MSHEAKPPFEVVVTSDEDGLKTAVVDHHTMQVFRETALDGAEADRRVRAAVLRRVADLVEGGSVVIPEVDALFRTRIDG